LKQPDASVAKFRELLALNPENPELKFEMFAKLYQHGFDDQAISFGKETAQPMEIVRHYNNKGVLLAKAGNMAEAVTEYKRALRFYPKFKQNYRIYFNIALAYTNEKNREAYVQAQEYLEKCLELQPEFDKAKNTLDVVRKALGQKKAV
jgi:tetratricopeptide (TPR) repeat protein